MLDSFKGLAFLPKYCISTHLLRSAIKHTFQIIEHPLLLKKTKAVRGDLLVSFDGSEINSNLKAALILPDGKEDSPAYLVFQNYEKILKWNRSLRFALAVCVLKERFENEI